MTTPRILFVDDEAPVLDALKDLLRKYRGTWDMSFVTSGAEALAILGEAPVDVVVSDMRMPGMDGTALLSEVKARYPATARLVLSGHADRETVVRALPVVQQYLSKPCDSDVLRKAIDRTCALQARLHDPAMRTLVGRLGTLPSVPRIYQELTALLARDDVSLARIAAVVEQDPAMVAKMLQLVNSAYFGLARRITSIEQAASYLGLQLVKSLALTAHVFGATAPTPAGFRIEHLQRTALSTARVAARLAAKGDAEDAFAAGVMCDVGQMVLASALPDQFALALTSAVAEGRPLHEVEPAAYGVTHADVGAYLLGVWGLPLQVVEAVAYHHAPSAAPPESRDLVRSVHVAGALVAWHYALATDPGATDTLDRAFLEASGGLDDLPRWREVAREEVEAAVAAAHGSSR